MPSRVIWLGLTCDPLKYSGEDEVIGYVPVTKPVAVGVKLNIISQLEFAASIAGQLLPTRLKPADELVSPLKLMLTAAAVPLVI